MKKPKKKKVRKMNSYAMGSGNTGVIKGYMPDPSEVFRQDEINANQAISEAASNPLIQGLDALGAITSQVGMSMMSSAGSAKGKNIGAKGDSSTNVNFDVKTGMNKLDFLDWEAGSEDWQKSYAKGTGPEGTDAKVNAEDGEVIETPDGEQAELKGKKHTEGGIDLEVPEGTKIFSDQLKIGGKTMAERKKKREGRLKKITKSLDNDPTDKIAKETFKRTKEKNDYEEQSDLMVQGFARQLDDAYTAAMGTGPEGVKSYENGTGLEGVTEGAKNFFEGFTGGDYMSLFGNLYSGLAPLAEAKKNAASDTPNVNQYKNFGQDAIATVEDAGGMIEGQKGQAEKNLAKSRTTAIKRVRGSARGINQANALQLGVDVNTNQAMSDLYSTFSEKMIQNAYKKAGLQNQKDQVVMAGAEKADLANRMDKDNTATQIGVAKETLGRGIQTIGKELNQNKRTRMLSNLANQLSKHGLKFDNKGNIIE